MNNKNNKYSNLINKLSVLNPLNTLKRGYSITKLDNKVISNVKDIKVNDTLNIKLSDGEIISTVKEIKNE